MNLKCPVCGLALYNSEKVYMCDNKHSFDISRDGYVNLLIRHTKSPGDSAKMVRARSDFLRAGYYAPFRSALTEVVGHTDSLLDAGCGEGYYTNAFQARELCALDMSRDALKIASRGAREAGKGEQARFCVASIFELPLFDGSVSTVTSVFAPYSSEEFSRVLPSGGRVISVIPGARHLMGMKHILYEKAYENDERDYVLEGFSEKNRVRVSYDIEISSSEQIGNLLMMTPYFWRTPRENIERLLTLTRLETRVEFIISEYVKG